MNTTKEPLEFMKGNSSVDVWQDAMVSGELIWATQTRGRREDGDEKLREEQIQNAQRKN